MIDLPALCADLAAEHAALHALVADLDPTAWATPTPAVGWTVRDQIGHLAYFDEKARLAVTAPDRFTAEEHGRPQEDLERYQLALARRFAPGALLAWWREGSAALITALHGLTPETRVPWYGPAMGAATFVTARLMETWSHGQDVADALGLLLPATSRLRHVADLGVRTRAFSYAIRGRTPPTASVRVELLGPEGARWNWGDGQAADRIVGPARDFCLVVTQRRHPADTDLVITGPLAREWMAIAQAFAGRPGAGRKSGQFPRATERTLLGRGES